MRLFAKRRRRGIVSGEGNVIRNLPDGVELYCFGEGNIIEFAEPGMYFRAHLLVGAADHPVCGCTVRIGARTTCEGAVITLMESGSALLIGDDCMISTGVELWASDTHAILDGEGRVVNCGQSLTVGDHVWLCKNAALLKDVVIPDGCVVGYGAVVSGALSVGKNSVLAGNPARVVRTDVTWDRRRPDQMQIGI